MVGQMGMVSHPQRHEPFCNQASAQRLLQRSSLGYVYIYIIYQVRVQRPSTNSLLEGAGIYRLEDIWKTISHTRLTLPHDLSPDQVNEETWLLNEDNCFAAETLQRGLTAHSPLKVEDAIHHSSERRRQQSGGC